MFNLKEIVVRENQNRQFEKGSSITTHNLKLSEPITPASGEN